MSDSPYVSVSEAARILGSTRKFVYALVKRGQLTAYRDDVPARPVINIPRSEVEALAARRRASLPPS